MSGEDVILTPWHYVIVPSEKVLDRRLTETNPAVRTVLWDHDDSWDAALRALVDQGATDDEIWQGDWLTLLPIPLRRHLPETLQRVRDQARADNVTTEAVRTERGRRLAANEHYGYDALADHFHVSESTIRRRLGAPGGK